MPGTTCVDCRFRSLHDVMKEVGRIIHLAEQHNAADIHSRIQKIAHGEYPRPRMLEGRRKAAVMSRPMSSSMICRSPRPRVYLAGPLFNDAERTFNVLVAQRLEQLVDVLPATT